MSDAPRLAIQIVTWNSEDVIGECLASLAAQSVRDFELVIVDNASQDATVARIEAALARGLAATLVRAERNTGFCGGHNLALGRSRAPWVLLLNPDTTLGADFVKRAIETSQRIDADVGTVAPLILREDGRIDSTGLFLDRLRRVFDRGQGRSPELYAREEDVFGCTGAAALHRRAMLLDVAEGGRPLDERLFAYYDDLDLSWRAQLRGWRCRYVPSLVVRHARAGRNAVRAEAGRSPRALEQRLAVRNRLLVLLKCERLRDALAALPWLVPYEAARLVYVVLRAPRSLPGYADAVRLAPSFWRSRRIVEQRARPARLLAAPFFPHVARNAS